MLHQQDGKIAPRHREFRVELNRLAVGGFRLDWMNKMFREQPTKIAPRYRIFRVEPDRLAVRRFRLGGTAEVIHQQDAKTVPNPCELRIDPNRLAVRRFRLGVTAHILVIQPRLPLGESASAVGLHRPRHRRPFFLHFFQRGLQGFGVVGGPGGGGAAEAVEFVAGVEGLQEGGEPAQALPGVAGAVAHQVPDVEEALDQLIAGARARGRHLLDQPQQLQAVELGGDGGDLHPAGLGDAVGGDRVPVQGDGVEHRPLQLGSQLFHPRLVERGHLVEQPFEIGEVGLLLAFGPLQQLVDQGQHPRIAAGEGVQHPQPLGLLVENADHRPAGLAAGEGKAAQAFQQFLGAERLQPVEAEELVEGRPVIAALGQPLHRRTVEHRPVGGLEGTAQLPVLIGRQGVEHQIQIVHQQHRPPAGGGDPGPERLGGAVGGLPVGLAHLAVQPLGVGDGAGLLQPLGQRLAAIAPELVEGADVVLLLAEGQRQQLALEIVVAGDGDGEAAEQAGLAHAALAGDHPVPRLAVAGNPPQLLEQKLEQLLTGDEGGQEVLFLQPSRSVDGKGDRQRLFVSRHGGSASSGAAGRSGSGSGSRPLRQPPPGSRRQPGCPAGL